MQHKPKPLSKKRRKNLGNLAIKLHADGMSFVDIAKRFGVTDNTIFLWIKEAKNGNDVQRKRKTDRADGGQEEQGVRKLISKCWAHHGGAFPVGYTEGPFGRGTGDRKDHRQAVQDSDGE